MRRRRPRLLGHRRGERAPDQADRLIELVDEVLRDAGLDYGALDVIAVNHGPGSFTGVRTGVAAARGLALAARPAGGRGQQPRGAGRPRSAPQPAGTIVAALDARRGQVYVQSFDHRLAPLERAAARWRRRTVRARPAPRRRSGSWATARALIRAALPEAWPIVAAGRARRSALGVARRALARLAAGERPGPGHAVQPLYLRPPDARLPAPRRRARGAAVGA